MAVNFPNNPTPGLSWLDQSNSVTYTWDGAKWVSTGAGVSLNSVVFSINNDDTDLIGGSTTIAINAALIANLNIANSGNLSQGNYVIIIDTTNPDFNVNVPVGQYIYDGAIWIRIPSVGAQVLTVFGRIGSVVAAANDYGLTMLSDVDITTTTPTSTTNSLLRFNGTDYVPGEARNSPTVTLPLTKTGSDVTPALGFNIDGLNILPTP